jgi:hypothetical protein
VSLLLNFSFVRGFIDYQSNAKILLLIAFCVVAFLSIDRIRPKVELADRCFCKFVMAVAIGSVRGRVWVEEKGGEVEMFVYVLITHFQALVVIWIANVIGRTRKGMELRWGGLVAVIIAAMGVSWEGKLTGKNWWEQMNWIWNERIRNIKPIEE